MRRTGASPEEIAPILDAPASARWPSGLLALVGVLALMGSTWWLARRTTPVELGASAASESAESRLLLALAADPTDDRPPLAVLPFADMTPDGKQSYFSDWITEEILNTLAKIRELKVAARTSAFAFRDRQLDLRTVAYLYRLWLQIFDPIRERPEIQRFLRNAGLEGAAPQRTPRSATGRADRNHPC